MATGRIPEDGEVQLGPVILPPGRRVTPEDGEPVAWVTEEVVPRPGRVWSALLDLRLETGLAPVLLDPADNPEDFFFFGDVDPGEIDGLAAAQVLAEMWPEFAGPPPGKERDLAPAEDARIPAATLTAALDSFQAAHIGLVPAARPADVLATVGWVAFDDLAEHGNGVWIGSVLRSFEVPSRIVSAPGC